MDLVRLARRVDDQKQLYSVATGRDVFPIASFEPVIIKVPNHRYLLRIQELVRRLGDTKANSFEIGGEILYPANMEHLIPSHKVFPLVPYVIDEKEYSSSRMVPKPSCYFIIDKKSFYLAAEEERRFSKLSDELEEKLDK